MNKVDTGYYISDGRKFETLESGLLEFNRLKSFCYRQRDRTDDDIKFLIGLSEICNHNTGKMGYEASKRFGGKKSFICHDLTCINPQTGDISEKLRVKPHVHVMVYGIGASSQAEKILNYLRKRCPDSKFGKGHLKTERDIAGFRDYILNQSCRTSEIGG